MKKFGWMAVCLLLLVTVPFMQSCSDDDDEQNPQEELPDEFRAIQGNWVMDNGERKICVRIEGNKAFQFVFMPKEVFRVCIEYNIIKKGKKFYLEDHVNPFYTPISLQADGRLKVDIEEGPYLVKQDFTLPEHSFLKFLKEYEGKLWKLEKVVDEGTTMTYPTPDDYDYYMKVHMGYVENFGVSDGNKWINYDCQNIIIVDDDWGLNNILPEKNDLYRVDMEGDYMILSLSGSDMRYYWKRSDATLPEYDPETLLTLLQGKWQGYDCCWFDEATGHNYVSVVPIQDEYMYYCELNGRKFAFYKAEYDSRAKKITRVFETKVMQAKIENNKLFFEGQGMKVELTKGVSENMIIRYQNEDRLIRCCESHLSLPE